MTKGVNITRQVKLILTPEEGAVIEKKSQIQSISGDIEANKEPNLDVKNIEKCMGDPNADAENPVLKQEQYAQVRIESRCIPFVTFHFI